jgi:ABC-type bacteriocin/lantibiotic exporter with double-glycine peptidase domain
LRLGYNQSQAIVSDALGDLNVAPIVVAHRPGTVQRADCIIVMEDGKNRAARHFQRTEFRARRICVVPATADA